MVWQEDLVNTHNVLHDLEMESQSRKEEVSNLAMTAEVLLQQLEDELQDAKDTTIQPEKEYVANLEELVDQLVHEKDFSAGRVRLRDAGERAVRYKVKALKTRSFSFCTELRN